MAWEEQPRANGAGKAHRTPGTAVGLDLAAVRGTLLEGGGNPAAYLRAAELRAALRAAELRAPEPGIEVFADAFARLLAGAGLFPFLTSKQWRNAIRDAQESGPPSGPLAAPARHDPVAALQGARIGQLRLARRSAGNLVYYGDLPDRPGYLMGKPRETAAFRACVNTLGIRPTLRYLARLMTLPRDAAVDIAACLDPVYLSLEDLLVEQFNGRRRRGPAAGEHDAQAYLSVWAATQPADPQGLGMASGRIGSDRLGFLGSYRKRRRRADDRLDGTVNPHFRARWLGQVIFWSIFQIIFGYAFSTVDAAEKVREARLRRTAERRGLKLVKSRRRDPLAVDYGRYVIVNPDSNRHVAGELGSASAMRLDDVEAWLASPGSETVEVVVKEGRRIVRRSLPTAGRPVVIVEHDFPDAVRHHYSPAGIDEDVLLYQGEFSLPDDGRVFKGDIRFRWRPSAHVKARGERMTSPADLAALSELLSGTGHQGMWVAPGAVVVKLPGGTLPSQPKRFFVPQGLPERSVHEARIEQQVGDPTALEQVTFLVPNGWLGHDGGGICDSENLAQAWQGRTEAAGDGWIVTFDRDAAMDPAAWKDLKESGGHRFTHAGRLSRADGSAFTGDEAFEALDRVRLGLNLALGRRVTCALPVGWQDGQPVWCRWRRAPVDGYRDVSHWLDDTISYRQVGDVVSRVLAFTASPVNRESLKYATSYYVAANVDVDVELSVGVPVSGLQLLAYLRFVTQRDAYSRTQWKEKDTEEELRLLIEDIGINTSVPAHFSHLTDARDRLASNGPLRDALGVIIKMRNVVTHPTRDQPGAFSVYEWAEGGMLARYWLCLSLLNTVGYQGQIAEIMQPQPRWLGQLQSVPW